MNSSPTPTPILNAVCLYSLMGLNVLPAVKAKKYPVGISHSQYKDCPAPLAQIQAWFASGQYDALCLLTGNGIEAIDFDDVPTAGQFRAKLSGSEAGAALAPKLLVQRTPSGGTHFLYKVEGMQVPGNLKLAAGKVETPGPGRYNPGPDGQAVEAEAGEPHAVEAKLYANGRWNIASTLIETRGTGGLILTAPSPGYEVTQGDFPNLPVPTTEERDLLIDLAGSFDQGGAAKASAKPAKPREPWVPDMAKPGHRYPQRTSAEDVVAMLTAHGWQAAGGNKQWLYLTRPSKDEGVSGSVLRDGGVFYCFTSSDYSFVINTSYSPFKVRAMLEFDGNLQAAEEAVLGEERELIDSAIERAAESDVGAPLEQEVVWSLAALRQTDLAEFSRGRQRIKDSNRKVSLRELDRALSSVAPDFVAPDSCNTEDQSMADRLVEMVRGVAELYHDQDDRRYASFKHDGHIETWGLDSKGFREWLGALFFREEGKAPRDQSIKDAANALAGFAKFEGGEQKVWLRAAVHEGRYYLDLCDDDWRAIEVSADGWKVVDRPPVKFKRASNMTPAPEPERGGVLDLLWNSVNVGEKDRPLVLAFLLEALRPETGFPLLEPTCEQGSGKSLTQDRLRTLMDPSTANLRTAPKNPEDIFVATANSWLISYNNLSRLSGPMQDALCRLATGGGFATRKLYTNDEEALIKAKRPVMLNGLVRLVSAQDLVGRTVGVAMQLIEKGARRSEGELDRQFETDLPGIIGGQLDLFCLTLKRLPDVKLEELPRMADFAKLGEAMLQAQESPPGRFLALYNQNRRATVVEAMEASPVACAARDLAIREGAWAGTMKNLYRELQSFRSYGEGWPRGPRGLGDALRRAMPGLREQGVEVEFDPQRRTDGYHVMLRHRPPESLDEPGAGIQNDEGMVYKDFMQQGNISGQSINLDPTTCLQ